MRGKLLNKLFSYRFILILLLLVYSGSKTQLFAQEEKVKTRILFLFDASGSMYATMDKDNRINIAKRIMGKLMDSLQNAKGVEVALRVYGHTSPPSRHDCKDTKLEVPFSRNNHQKIKDKVNSITPKGTTLIAYSLQLAAGDFPKEPNVRNVIVLITDGIEECQGDPCAVSEALQSSGVILRPFIIGLGGNEDFRKAFECVGRYYDAMTEADFDLVLNVVISQAINNTTAQVNLLDIYSKPTETNVDMTFYDQHSGQMIYNYIHTMNEKGVPDTLLLDPIYKYRMKVHTIPPVEKSNIEITPGKHTIIGVDAPQGSLVVRTQGGITNYSQLKFIVRKANQMETLNVQDANISEKYIVGKYDLEILTLPRMIVKGVEIIQSNTNTVAIEQPGRLTVMAVTQNYYADIYKMERDEIVWIYKIPMEARMQNILMQPGKYKIIYRAKNSYRSNQTFERQFEIKSGATTNFNLN